ncbi:Rap1a/Tai family immunity protein [Klebsiella quasipneumoniae]
MKGLSFFCQPFGSLQTYADVVYQYLNDNPDKRVNSAESLVIAAMQASFRCKEPQKLNGNK